MTDRYEFGVDEHASLDARIDAGTIDVRNGAAGRITVSAPGGDDDWVVESIGDTVTIRPVKRWRSRTARIAIDVPEGARVEVRSASAAVRLAGTFGDTQLQSASGDLTVDSLSTVHASTGSGAVRVADVVADASVTSASGDVEIGGVGGRLTVSTASGDVRVARVDGDVRVGTTSGDVRIDRTGGAEIAVKTVSGDVSLGLPSGIRVEPDLTTLSGRTHLPAPAPPATDAATGGGHRRVVRVSVRTVSGDITIDRAR